MVEASAASTGLPRMVSSRNTTVSLPRNQRPGISLRRETSRAFSRLKRITCCRGDSLGSNVSAAWLGTTRKSMPTDARSSFRRGEAEARINREVSEQWRDGSLIEDMGPS